MIRLSKKKIFRFLPLLLLIPAAVFLIRFRLSLSGRYALPPVSGWEKSAGSPNSFITLKNETSYFDIQKITGSSDFKADCQRLYDSEKGTNLSFGATTFRGRSGHKCAFDQKDFLVSYFFVPGPDFYYQINLKYPKDKPEEIKKINELVNELVLF